MSERKADHADYKRKAQWKDRLCTLTSRSSLDLAGQEPRLVKWDCFGTLTMSGVLECNDILWSTEVLKHSISETPPVSQLQECIWSTTRHRQMLRQWVVAVQLGARAGVTEETNKEKIGSRDGAQKREGDIGGNYVSTMCLYNILKLIFKLWKGKTRESYFYK